MLKKPEKIDSWILEDKDNFYNFLAAYMDCEGNWHLTKSHEIHARVTFRLRGGDKEVLENMKNKLEGLGYSCAFSLEKLKGSTNLPSPLRVDIYNLTLNKREDVLRLIRNLLPLSKHSEKIRKMKIMLNNKDDSYSEIITKWNKLRNKIKKEILKNL